MATTSRRSGGGDDLEQRSSGGDRSHGTSVGGLLRGSDGGSLSTTLTRRARPWQR